MTPSKLFVLGCLVVLLTGSPALAARELQSANHLPFGLGKGKGKGAPQQPVVAPQPVIVAPQPQVIVQPQPIMMPYVAAAPQQPPVVAAAPQVVPPPPKIEYIPVPTPVPTPVETIRYVPVEKIVEKEKIVVKKVPHIIPVPVKKHHFLPLKIAGAVAKAVLSNMDNDVTVENNGNKGALNVTEEVTYEPAVPLAAPVPAPVPVVAGVAVPTYPATNETITASWSG